MGMNVKITGIKENKTEEYINHSAVVRACVDAGISTLPKETIDFFNCGERPSLDVINDILEIELIEDKHYVDISGFDDDTFELHLDTLPACIRSVKIEITY